MFPEGNNSLPWGGRHIQVSHSCNRDRHPTPFFRPQVSAANPIPIHYRHTNNLGCARRDKMTLPSSPTFRLLLGHGFCLLCSHSTFLPQRPRLDENYLFATKKRRGRKIRLLQREFQELERIKREAAQHEPASQNVSPASRIEPSENMCLYFSGTPASTIGLFVSCNHSVPPLAK